MITLSISSLISMIMHHQLEKGWREREKSHIKKIEDDQLTFFFLQVNADVCTVNLPSLSNTIHLIMRRKMMHHKKSFSFV